MAETMRPKLLNCLKAVHKGERSKESDSSPFITLMKNVADVWFRTIFSTLLPFKMLLRTIDVFLVFGIEFLQKFGLAYLSKKEKFIINSIKTETKGLQLGASADALIIAGNLTKSKLLNKAENFDVEPLIKKCLKKDSYLHLKRFNFLSKAIILESKSSERILRLKKCKNLLHENPLNAFTATAIIKALSSEKVTRTEFCKVTNEIANWAHLASNSIFTLFDQNGDEEIEKSLISIGVSLLVSDSIDAKLLLCFEVFDTDESGFLSTTELAEMVIQIENALDGRSSFYQKEAESMMKVLDSNGDSKISIEEFIKTVKANKIFQPIIEYIQMASADHIEKVLEDQYEDIHSPLSVSINYSDNESASDNLIEKNILEAEIQYTEFENPDENILEDDPEKVKHDLEEEKEETVEEILENQKDFMENSDKYISEEKMYESFKASTDIEQEVNTRNTKNNLNRSESTGGKIETLKNEHSVNLEHFVDFPEAQNDTKDRDCVRLCSKESCYIF